MHQLYFLKKSQKIKLLLMSNSIVKLHDLGQKSTKCKTLKQTKNQFTELRKVCRSVKCNKKIKKDRKKRKGKKKRKKNKQKETPLGMHQNYKGKKKYGRRQHQNTRHNRL
jgi:hypothetical protein